MQKSSHISLLSVFIVSNCIAMEQPATVPTPMHPMHQHYAQANAEAYYDAISRQKPSYISQIGHDVFVQTAVQVASTAFILGITSACSGIYYLIKGPSDEQRQIEIMLTKNENSNFQNTVILKREALEVQKEERKDMMQALKELYAFSDEIVSPKEKAEAKEQFLKIFLARFGQNTEQLPIHSTQKINSTVEA